MSSSKQAVVFWDSCVAIDLLEQRPTRIEHINPIYLDARAKKTTIIMSVMAIVECTRIKGMTDAQETAKKITGFFKRSEFSVRPIDRGIAELARHLRASGFDMYGEDAVQVATAISLNVPVFLTTDGDWSDAGKSKRRAKRPLIDLDKKMGPKGGGTPLRIMTPRDYMDDVEAVRHPLLRPQR